MRVVGVVALGLLSPASGCTVYDDVTACAAVDVDADGQVSTLEHKQGTALRDAFRLLDADFSGTLTDAECMRAAISNCAEVHGLGYPEYLDARRSFFQQADWSTKDPRYALWSRFMALVPT
jgi:hypothetical protein